MISLQDLAILLARSGMTKEEKDRWLKLLPFLPKALVLEFAEILQKEVEATAELRKQYQEEIRTVMSKRRRDQ